MKTIKSKNEMAEFLNKFNWDYFCTFSTSYTLTSKSARRAVERFYDYFNQNYGGCNIMWATEPFDLKEGCHLHALIKTDPSMLHSIKNSKEALTKAWRKVTGGSDNINKRNQIHFRKYNPKLGANKYLIKYSDRSNADYDFFFGLNQHCKDKSVGFTELSQIPSF